MCTINFVYILLINEKKKDTKCDEFIALIYYNQEHKIMLLIRKHQSLYFNLE